jgi:hypothetical protein
MTFLVTLTYSGSRLADMLPVISSQALARKADRTMRKGSQKSTMRFS